MSSQTETLDLNERLALLHNPKKVKNIQLTEDLPHSTDLILDYNGYIRGFAKMAFSAVVAVVFLAVVIVIALVAVSGREPIVLAYAIDSNNSIVSMEPVNERTVTEEDVLIYVADATETLHNLSFTDFGDHTAQQSNKFTSDNAFENYQRALLDSKIIERISNDNQVSWVEPISAPIIVDYEDNTWLVKIDFRWFLGGGDYATTGVDMQATYQISRVPRSENLEGLGIDTYLIAERGAE